MRSWQRRSFIGLGMGAALTSGLTPSLFAGTTASTSQAAAVPPVARARQVLIVLEQGGVSHVDTWDPKPETVAEHRSPYKPIDTSAPGVQFTELMRHTSRHADKLAVVRSMTHKLGGHPEGTAFVLQGAIPGGPLQMPDMGTAVAHIAGSPNPQLPPYVMIPGNGEQSYNTSYGFLSAGLKVFKTGGRDLSAPGWKVNDLGFLAGVDNRRFRDRQDLLSNLDVGLTASVDTANTGSSQTMEKLFRQAFDMLGNPQTQAAFDLSTEPEPLREAYGRGHRGQCYLLGRKLIESGVRTVVLDVREPETKQTPGGFNMNWDHHDLIYSTGSCGTIRDKAGGEGRYGIGTWQMMGSTDQAFGALLEDMSQRGLLHETLVCFVTEFGRTPKLNQFQGRDHWPYAYSIAFAGAGVRGGQVIGKTDRDGGYVLDQAFSPIDCAATIYTMLGIDLDQPVYTREHRPVFLAHDGAMISKLVS